MFGPLLMLQCKAFLCPCLLKEEDRTARQALSFVSGRRILWIRSTESSSGFSLGNLFRSPTAGARNQPPTRAIFRLVDNDEGLPEILVEPVAIASPLGSDVMTDLSSSSRTGGGASSSSSPSIQLHITLRRVDRVTLKDGTDEIILYAKAPIGSKTPKELLRFSLVGAASTDNDTNTVNSDESQSSTAASSAAVVPVKTEERNLFLHHMAVLVEWERQQNRDVSLLHEEEDEPNFLTARANKAAHFAQRELELQTTKREREKRKAKFSAAGLKYTALAMAGRTEGS